MCVLFTVLRKCLCVKLIFLSATRAEDFLVDDQQVVESLLSYQKIDNNKSILPKILPTLKPVFLATT